MSTSFGTQLDCSNTFFSKWKTWEMEDEIRSVKHDKSISNILINIITSFWNSYSIINDSFHSMSSLTKLQNTLILLIHTNHSYRNKYDVTHLLFKRTIRCKIINSFLFSNVFQFLHVYAKGSTSKKNISAYLFFAKTCCLIVLCLSRNL